MTPLALNIPGFKSKYPDEEACKKELLKLKTTVKNNCIKCGETSFRKGNSEYHKRCTSCGYEESVLKNTVFEGIRFSLDKAFYLVYRIRMRNGRVSSIKLMLETLLSTSATAKFRKKVINRLSELHLPLSPGSLTLENFLNGLY